MADIYYDAQAVGANNGTSKADAYIAIASAAASAVPGDTVWISHTSIEVRTSGAGVSFDRIKLISVDFSGSTPPVEADFLAGGFIGSALFLNMVFSGIFYARGVTFNAGAIMQLGSGFFVLENSVMDVSFNNSNSFVVSNADVTFINSDLDFGNKVNLFAQVNDGRFTMRGGSITHVNNTAIFKNQGGDPSVILLDAVDLSGIDIPLVEFTAASKAGLYLDGIGCLLNALMVLTSAIEQNASLAMYGSSDTNKPYYIQEEYYEGVIQAETTVIKTDGSSDGVTPISLKFVTNTNAIAGYFPVKNRIPILFWVDDIGIKTFEVDILTDNVTLTEDEAYIELTHPQAGVLRALATSKVHEGANLAASVAAWTTTGIGTPVKQKISITVNVGQKGWVEACICFAKPSSVMYADVEVLDGDRQYLAGQAYINAEAATAPDYPIETDVRDGIDYDSGNLTGNLTSPAEGDVEAGVQYGANGTEFTGTLATTTVTEPLEIIEIEALEVIEL